MKCPFCEDGTIREYPSLMGGEVWQDSPCPHCKDGVITLAVEEKGRIENNDGKRVGNAAITRPLTDEKVEQALWYHQRDNSVHPFTCGNNSNHILRASINEMRWLCDTCCYEQPLTIDDIQLIYKLNGLPVVIVKGE